MIETINQWGGLWGFASLILAASAWLAALKIFLLPARRIKNVNFCFFVGQVGNGKFRNRLYIMVRNLSGQNVLISSSYLHVRDRSCIHEHADGDSASGLYEVKFKGKTEIYSEGIALLLSGEDDESFVPLKEDADLQASVTTMTKGWFGNYLQCDVTVLREKPRVRRCKIPLRNIQYRGAVVDRAPGGPGGGRPARAGSSEPAGARAAGQTPSAPGARGRPEPFGTGGG